MTRAFAILTALLLAPTAYAQDETPPPSQEPAPAPAAQPAPAAAPAATAAAGDYTGPDIDRSLTLKQGGIEGELGILINRFSVTDPLTGTSVSSTGESLALAGRYGIMQNLDAGALLAFQLNPNGSFSDFLVNSRYQFMSGGGMMAAGRVDLGVSHASAGTASTNSFDLGLGLPLKYALSPMLAFITGSQYNIVPFGLLNTEDILFFQFGDQTVVNLNIPVGVLAQIAPMFAAQFRTGFSLVHTSNSDAKFVPINIDLIGNLNVSGIGIDPYFTFNIAGNTDDYTAFMTFLIGARVHL